MLKSGISNVSSRFGKKYMNRYINKLLIQFIFFIQQNYLINLKKMMLASLNKYDLQVLQNVYIW